MVTCRPHTGSSNPGHNSLSCEGTPYPPDTQDHEALTQVGQPLSGRAEKTTWSANHVHANFRYTDYCIWTITGSISSNLALVRELPWRVQGLGLRVPTHIHQP